MRLHSTLIALVVVLGPFRMCLEAAELRGAVQDGTGALLPGVSVTVTDQESGRRYQAKSGPDGLYFLRGLPGGTYTLQLSSEGFQDKKLVGLVLSEGENRNIEEILLPASVRTEVVVGAMAEMVDTSKATQARVLTSQELIAMPTSSRNITHMVVTEAGVSAGLPDRTAKGLAISYPPGNQAEDGSQSLNPSVNGARPTNNAMQLNGLDITNMMSTSGGLGSQISIPLEAMQQVEMQTALYSANTGRNGGGNIQMVLRSGTNQFHGGAYFYLQNEAFNANEFFLNSAGSVRPRFRRNDGGVHFGGPIWKDRTHFYATVQRSYLASAYAASGGIKRAAFPTGLGDVRTRETIADVANAWLQSGNTHPDFAQNWMKGLLAYPADQQPGLIAQFFSDPNTLTFRKLTAADIHPVAVNILNQKRNGQFLIPSVKPNFVRQGPTASFGEEYLQTLVAPNYFSSWSGTATLDHSVTNANRLKLSYNKSVQFIHDEFGWSAASPSPTQAETPGWTGQLTDTHVFGPGLVNELRAGFFELHNSRVALYHDITNSSLGIYNPIEVAVGGLAALMPTIDISTNGASSGGIGNAWDFYDRQRVINLTNSLTRMSRRHSLQVGAEWRRTNLAGEYMARTNGDLDYGNWVLFFTGHGAAGGGSDLDQGNTARNFTMHDYGVFVQDDFKIHPRLTLNLGVRYDLFGSPVERNGRIGNYYLPDVAAELGVQPGYQIPSNSIVFRQGFTPSQLGLIVSPDVKVDLSNVHPAKYASTLRGDHNNLAPRIGFAWRPFQTDKIVLRGGYGVFFERTSGTFKGDMQTSPPFFILQNVPAPLDMANPYPRLNINPFEIPLSVQMVVDGNGRPSWRRRDGSPFPTTEPFNPKSANFIDPRVRTPYMQQWTIDLQWEPRAGNLLDFKFVGSKGTGLLAKVNLAQPLDPRVTPVNGFTSLYDKTGAAISPDFFVPSQFLGLSRSGFQRLGNYGHSNYNSFQLMYRRRFSKGLMANVAYTFSKSLDNISGNSVIGHDTFGGRLNRGASDFDRTQRLTVSYSYDIPLRFSNPFLRLALGGWTQAGMLTMQSGSPFSVVGSSATNAIWAQTGSLRVSFAPGKTLADAVLHGPTQDRLVQYFDPMVFVDSPNAWGNSGRNILRGPSQKELELSLAKRFRLFESASADLRLEVYNVTNTPNFSNPTSTLAANGPGTAGRISSTIGGPRTMQSTFRITF